MPLWWSLNAGESGEWPVADHMHNLFTPRDRYRYGKVKRKSRRLAGRYTMNKTMDRGDYQWINTAFCIQGYSNEECCHKCKCRKNGNMSYADFFESALHRLARRTTIDYLREVITLNPLCLSRAWCLEMLRTDLMHNTFQGNAARLVATVLVELCMEGHWGRQGFANLPLVVAAANKFCKKLNLDTTKLPKITREKLGYANTSMYPELKGDLLFFSTWHTRASRA